MLLLVQYDEENRRGREIYLKKGIEKLEEDKRIIN